MNILILITRGEIGGAQVFVFNLAKALKKLGHNVTVALNEEPYLYEKLKSTGIKTLTFKWLKRSHNPFAIFFFILEMITILNEEKFDILHLNSSNAMFGAIAATLSNNKPKTVFTVHGLSMVDHNYETFFLTKYIYRFLFKTLLGVIDRAVFVCKNNLTSAKELKIVREGEVIYNGLDSSQLQFLAPSEARHFLGELVGARS